MVKESDGRNLRIVGTKWKSRVVYGDDCRLIIEYLKPIINLYREFRVFWQKTFTGIIYPDYPVILSKYFWFLLKFNLNPENRGLSRLGI